MTSNLEKVHMHYVFANPNNFKLVEPSFYKNKEVQFVYKVVREAYEKSKSKEVPTLVEIVELVKLKDAKSEIPNDVLKAVLKVDMSQYRQEFLENLNESVTLGNHTKNALIDSIDIIKDIDMSNKEQVKEAAAQIRDLIDKATAISSEKIDIGSDFDNPDDHNQDTYVNKIPTGWNGINTFLNGGWDRKTLNVLMGETNIGKSIWMQNIMANAANLGYNCAYTSLEMSEKKVLKRLGSMRLNIPIAEYDELSKDREYMRLKIQRLKDTEGSQTLWGSKLGKANVKEFPAATLTVDELDQYVTIWKEVTGESLDLLVIDYITIMAPRKSMQIDNNLYMKGKHLAEGLRAIAQKHDLAVVTATQISKEKFGASDINLNDMPESKAIAEASDTIWAIIRNAQMKIEGKYHLKPLKLRDADFNYDRIGFDLDRNTLRIFNDVLLNQAT